MKVILTSNNKVILKIWETASLIIHEKIWGKSGIEPKYQVPMCFESMQTGFEKNCYTGFNLTCIEFCVGRIPWFEEKAKNRRHFINKNLDSTTSKSNLCSKTCQEGFWFLHDVIPEYM